MTLSLTSRRRTALPAVLVALVSAFCATSASALATGDHITVTSSNGVNVRSSPAGAYLGGQAYGATGTVVGGPQNAALGGVTYTWWNVDFTSGYDGWVVQDGITMAIPAGPPTINSPGTASSPGPPLATLTPTFSWNGVGGASGYGLYIFDVTSNSYLFQNVGGPKSGTSYALPSGYLSNNGHAYRWFMTSFSGATESSTSAALYFQAPTPITNPPTINSPGTASSPGPPLATLTPTFSWNPVNRLWTVYLRHHEQYLFVPKCRRT